MNGKLLTKHICDTVKEWQIKIGYREERMKLYYPAQSLANLLLLPNENDVNELEKALDEYVSDMKEIWGEIELSSDEKKERYCLDIPAKGISYIAKNIPDSDFLKAFLKIITTPMGKLEDVRACFMEYAEKCQTQFCEKDQTAEGLGHVFYFEANEEDSYIYCIEEDDFGLTYHRFDKADYEKMLDQGHGLHHEGH